MKIICSNIRGKRGTTKRRYLREIIAKKGANLVCIHETKTKLINSPKCYDLWGDNNIEWAQSTTNNMASRVLCI